MNEPTSRFQQIFFEVFESLPRQGPGSRECASHALVLCRELTAAPEILDLGCGVGRQTLHLAELTAGSIMAFDAHEPAITRLQETIAEHGLAGRVRAMVGDMAHLEQPGESFDLVWSEGALYSIGLAKALGICYGLLRPHGYLAFSDAIWRKENPPAAVKAMFEMDYPTMGTVADNLAMIQECGFEVVGHFALPDEAWWDEFYTPMEHRIAELRGKYADEGESLAILDQLAEEPAMHRVYADFYGYEFFVARRRGG
jgi:SAM-dependent methyltransferase